jgi:cytochrome c553
MGPSCRHARGASRGRNPGRRIAQACGWKPVRRIAFLAAFLAAGFCSIDARAADFSKSELQAKLGYCQDCHGPSARGFFGYYPIPRLAGQQPEYLENQLRAFIEHRRTNNIMFNVAHVLNPAMITALANSFKDFNPKPLGGAPRGLVEAGKKIFEDGVPDVNVAACAACHGPNATGSGQIPRLAGQLYPYVIKELTNWGTERGQIPTKPDTSAIMSPVAHSLTRKQLEAVAAFVSSLN